VTRSEISEKALGRARHVLVEHVARGHASGVVALVGYGEASQVLTVGAKALGATDPMRHDTILRITSMTKPVTAAAIDPDDVREPRAADPASECLA
jgi:CubicO group peptidase (beta-lactamase class C family)